MPRRSEGSILAIEYDILESGSLLERASGGFHGFGLAQSLADARGQQSLIGHGTLYKALSRMTTRGLLVAEWEDPDVAIKAARPRRKIYRVTAEGARALAARPTAVAVPLPQARASLA